MTTAEAQFSVTFEANQDENTAPIFLLPFEESYTIYRTNVQPIILGEYLDIEGDRVSQSFSCMNCLVDSQPFDYDKQRKMINI